MTNAERLFWWCADIYSKGDTCEMNGLDRGNPIVMKAHIDSFKLNAQSGTVTITYKPVELDDTSDWVKLSE